MHVAVLFYNIGGYHAARLQAVHTVCQQTGWRLTAIQVTDETQEHPWGALKESAFPIKTLLPVKTGVKQGDRNPLSPAANKPLTNLLNQLQPDVLAIPGWGFPISRAALAWCQRNSIPAILMSESKWDDEPRQWWKEWLKSWYITRYAAALVGGKLHRDYLVRLGFPGDRIFSGYDAVDNGYFMREAEAARADPDLARKRQPQIPAKPYFLTVTRFIKRKNVVRLVNAYAAYRQQIGKQAWDLVICGSGVEHAAIQQAIATNALRDCVHLPGFVTYSMMPAWYGLAEAFIHPALQEQWGLVINEACASGLPILCSQTTGACTELVSDRQNGFIFNPHCQEDIIQALIKIHQTDPKIRLQFGQISQKNVAHYSPDQFAQGLFQAIGVGGC